MSPSDDEFSDVDPGAVSIRDAATLMIVRDDPAFEVLMVQRSSTAVFGSSAWVFPGGRVDQSDGNSVDEMPWRRAAIRETFEEAGLLLGASEALLQAIGSTEQVAELRRSVIDGAVDLFAAADELGEELALDHMHEVGRFITPLGPPRRYDTYFYLAAAPDGQQAIPDGNEVTHARWMSPSIAIEEHRLDTFPLMSVTHRMLACLARYESVDAVLTTAASVPVARRVRVNDPNGAYDVLLPEDPGYEHAELEIEHGWVRL